MESAPSLTERIGEEDNTSDDQSKDEMANQIKMMILMI